MIDWKYADVGDKLNYAVCYEEDSKWKFAAWMRKDTIDKTKVVKKTKEEIGL